MTRFPANISWTDPYESAGWALNVDGQYRLEEEEQEAIEDLGWMDEGRPYLAVDRFSMTGVITLVSHTSHIGLNKAALVTNARC